MEMKPEQNRSVTKDQILDALIDLRQKSRPPGESNAAFARACKMKSSSQVDTVMRRQIPDVPKMELWVKGCGVPALSQFILRLEVDSLKTEDQTGTDPPVETPSKPKQPRRANVQRDRVALGQ